MLQEGLNILYKADLDNLIRRDPIAIGLFTNLKDVPISKIRAISQMNNPRLIADKPMLLINYKAGEIIAYLGAYHDYIIAGGKKTPIGWTNDLWVHPARRGQGLAGNLVVELYKQFDGNLIVADYVPNTFHIYNSKGKFSKLKPIDGKRIFLQKPDAAWMEKRFGLSLKKNLLNTYLKFLPDKHIEIKETSLLYKQNTIYKLETEHQNFIDLCKQETIFNYSTEEWQHWLLLPWLSETEQEERFHFSTYSKPFKQFCLELRDNANTIKALLFIMVRGEELKVKQIYTSQENYDEVIKTIIYTAQKFASKQILLYDANVLALLKKYSRHYIFAANSKKHLLCGNSIFNTLQNAHINVSDGDLAFT